MIDLLVCRDTHDFVRKEIHSGSKSVSFVFPVQVFSVECETGGEEGDPIVAAVERLLEYYKKHPFEREKDAKKNELSNVAMVAETLGLKEKLVKYIIDRRKAQKAEVLPGHVPSDGEKTVPDKKILRFYVAVDCITKKLLDYVISESAFSSMKVEQSDITYSSAREYYCRYKMGSSESERYVRVGQNYAGAISVPAKDDIIALLKRKRSDIKPQSNVKIIGEGPYELAVTCYYPATDCNNYTAANPFVKEKSLPMRALMNKWKENSVEIGAIIDNEMAKAKGEIAKSAGEQFKDVKKAIAERLRKVYPVLVNGERDSELLSRFVNMFSSYLRVIQIDRSGVDEAAATVRDRMAKTFALMDHRVAMYTFMEFLLSRCFNEYYNGDCLKEYESMNDSDLIDLYDLVAGSKGFVVSGLKQGERRVTVGRLKALFEGARNDTENEHAATRMELLLMGNLIEAQCDEGHPFNKIKTDCPEFISTVVHAQTARNNSKHGNMYYETFERDPYFKFVLAFEAIIGGPKEGEKVPEPIDFLGAQDLNDEFNNIYNQAERTLNDEKFTVKNGDAYEQILCETVAYLLEDSEYPSKLSNLYDELLLQLSIQLSGTYAIDENIRTNVVIPGSLSPKKAVCAANELMCNRRVVGSDSFFGSGDFARFIKRLQKKSIKELSTKDKLLYYILCLGEYEKGVWDNEFRQMLAMLATDTADALKRRKHNEQAKWERSEKEQYDKLHERALTLYEYFTIKIKEYEEKKNNGR